MKVMHLINRYIRGGAELVALAGHKSVIDNGFHSEVVSVRESKPDEALIQEYALQGVSSSIAVSKYRPWSVRVFLEVFRLSKRVRASRVTIVHSHCEIPDFFALMMRLFLIGSGVRFIRTVHNERFLGAKFGPCIESALSTLFDWTICISEKTFSNIKSRRKSILYNPIRFGCIDSVCRKRNGHLRVGVVGRFTPQKNQRALFDYIEAREWREEIPRYYFWGDGDKKSLPGYEIVGFEKNIENIYSNIDVLFIPSLFEGLSTVMVEALVRGVPVYSFDVSGVSDINKLISYEMIVTDFSEFEQLISFGAPEISQREIESLKLLFLPSVYSVELGQLYEDVQGDRKSSKIHR